MTVLFLSFMVRLRGYGNVYDGQKKLFLTGPSSGYSNYGGIMNIQISGKAGGLSRFGIFAEGRYYFTFNLMQPNSYGWLKGAECVQRGPGWSEPRLALESGCSCGYTNE